MNLFETNYFLCFFCSSNRAFYQQSCCLFLKTSSQKLTGMLMTRWRLGESLSTRVQMGKHLTGGR